MITRMTKHTPDRGATLTPSPTEGARVIGRVAGRVWSLEAFHHSYQEQGDGSCAEADSSIIQEFPNMKYIAGIHKLGTGIRELSIPESGSMKRNSCIEDRGS